MTLASDQRRALGAFLRARREALAPASVGLARSPQERRRTPGLRREEVAQLCGVSATWYTWFEQGRDIALSATALARLAQALQLTAVERAYLFELTRRRDPAPIASDSSAESAPGDLTAALQATKAPAYLMDRLWRARAWNEAAGRLFAPWFESGELCLLRYVFLHDSARAFICDWENRARRLLAEFRADSAHNSEDAATQALVGELQRASPTFTQFWNSHAVLAREGGARTFNHPGDGLVQYRQITLIPAAYPDHKIVMLLP